MRWTLCGRRNASLSNDVIAGTQPSTIHERARRRAFEIGDFLVDVLPILGKPECEYSWTPSRGLVGDSGVALTFLALLEGSGNSRFEAAMHDALRGASQLDDRPGVGLFDGVSGLRAVAGLASRIEPRYRRLVTQCDDFVDAALPVDPQLPESFSTYDLISGWAGIRLARAACGSRPADRVTSLLTWLCEDRRRWCLPHPVRTNNPPSNDLGMAHGISGVLSALALTAEDPGPFASALAATAYELLGCERSAGDAVTWPPTMQERDEGRYRSAWCYGAPGCIAAIAQVARAIGDVALEAAACERMSRLAQQPSSTWLIAGQGICHGLAGVALAFASVASASGLPQLWEAVDRTIGDLLDADALAGGRCSWVSRDGERFDEVNELDGVAGLALVLLTLTGACDASWMRLHGLAPIVPRPESGADIPWASAPSHV